MVSFLVVGPLVDVPVEVPGGIDDSPEVPREEPPESFMPLMDPGEVPGPDPVLQVRDVPVDPPDDEPVGAWLGADDFPERPGEDVRVLSDVPEVGSFAAAPGSGSA